MFWYVVLVLMVLLFLYRANEVYEEYIEQHLDDILEWPRPRWIIAISIVHIIFISFLVLYMMWLSYTGNDFTSIPGWVWGVALLPSPFTMRLIIGDAIGPNL